MPRRLANGRLVQTEVKNGSVSFAKTALNYVSDGGGSPQVQSVTGYDDTITPVKVDFDYDSYGNITNKRGYGHQVSGAWQVRRRTHLTYSTAYTNIYGLPWAPSAVTLVEVFDAQQNTNDGDDVLIAKSSYAYDNYVSMGGIEDYGGTANPPGHISGYGASYTARANVTGVTQWTDLAAGTTVQHLAKYDIFGNVVKAQVSCCQERDLTNTDATYWSQPDSEMSGDPNGVHQTTSTDYDFNTSLPVSATDAGGLTTNIGYDGALNPASATLPTGASAASGINYWDLSSSTSVSYTDGTNWLGEPITKTLTTSQAYDGWGRVIRSIDRNNAQVNTSYDSMGRVISRTNPFTAGGTPGPATTIQYDLANKAVITTLPGGNTVRSDYSGTTVTATDQVNRKIKRESDGLGRLIKVTEQDVTTGALTQETSYSYNLLDKLTQVNQGGQYRSYKYDAMGRLLFEKIPEQTPTINDGTGTYWTAAYAYTEFSSVKKKTDARGVETHYAVDALHRVTQIWYTGSGGDDSGSVRPALPSKVATTSELSLGYGSGGELSSVTLVTNNAFEYTENYTFDAQNRVASLTRQLGGDKTYVTSYEYNAASQPTKLTYPSGKQVNLAYDDRGRLSSLADQYLAPYANAMSYNVEARQTGLTLGNGVARTNTFDPNRSQLATQTASKNGVSLMNLNYIYDAAAGQSGATTTAGNTHQLISLTGTINGTTESASYTYDLAHRLITSAQSSNGASAQRRFAYDRWGNRTGEWDAVSGGSQIQSITLQQSGGAPTNRITSVTNSGVTANYTYDAAGNVTNDGTHSYTYDAGNRLVSVDGGATAQYSYDHQNRRVKKVAGGATTHYVWEGGKVIAEHDGAAVGPWTAKVDYVYARGVLIATRNYTIGQQCTTDSKGVTTCTTILQSTAVRYYVGDLWSTRLVLDASGNVIGRQAHLPFGEEFAESGTQEKHHFTSYEADGESGSDYAVNRQYSQSVGRFGSADPYQASGYLVNPQSWNRYSYVENDPIHNVDPLGLFARYPDEADPCCIGNNCGDSTPPTPSAPAVCVVTVTARELNGIGFLGYNHMFITLLDTATNRTDYFGAVGVGGGTGHDGGELVARYGLFDEQTAKDDFNATPVKQWTLVLPDSCASMFNFWASETEKIKAKHLVYPPVGGPNSNSFVYTLLNRGGLFILIDQINRWVKRNTVPPFGLGPVPGWGLDIS
jgi:RHS repeat-associated protein